MNRNEMNEHVEERNKLHKENETVLETARTEKRSMNAQEVEECGSRQTRIRELKDVIDVEKRHAETQAELAQPEREAITPTLEGSESRSLSAMDTPEYRSAFYAAIGGDGGAELRAVGFNVATKGDVLAPVDLNDWQAQNSDTSRWVRDFA